jgi:hypothetical protein
VIDSYILRSGLRAEDRSTRFLILSHIRFRFGNPASRLPRARRTLHRSVKTGLDVAQKSVMLRRMIEPAPPAMASTAYDLYYLVNGERLFSRSASHGVALIDAGRDSAVAWRAADREAGRQLWTDIVSVNMPDTDGKDAVDKCRIDFRGGRFLMVTDAGISGKVDRARVPVYRDFIRALHERLADAPEGAIRFTCGVSPTYRKAMLALGVITVLLFVVAPAVLVVDFHEWRAIGPLTAGATFIWPFWKKIGTNRPHVYDPHHPPGEPTD